jgi:hypothetical protein
MICGVRTIMTFALDPEKSARWWAGLLGDPLYLDTNDDGTVNAWFDLHGIEYGFHPADDTRNPCGGSPVVYWSVTNLAASRERLLTAGCAHHRGGPLRVDDQRQICQLTDPFGTIIGLDGP